MKKDLVEIVFIVDRSSSMEHLTDETIKGFNNFLAEQAEVPGEARVTLALFNHEYFLQMENVDIQVVKPLDRKSYVANGYTALLDAVGKTIDAVGHRLADTPESERPSRVIVCIITDGEENSSKQYTKPQIKEMVDHQGSVYKWEFAYLGANVDAFDEAGGLGIGVHNTANFAHSGKGVAQAYAAASYLVRNTRMSRSYEPLENVIEDDEGDTGSA